VKKSVAAASAALLTSGVLVAVAPPVSASPAPVRAPDRASRQPIDQGVADRANAALQAHRQAVRPAAGESYTVYSARKDATGGGAVRYTRTYHGLRVYGGDFVVHTAADGAWAGASVGLKAPLTLGTTAKIGAAAAVDTAKKHFAGTIATAGRPELIVDASAGTGRLAWETVVSGRAPDGQTPSRLHVISDATTGGYIGSFDEIETVAGTGNSLYDGTVTVDTTPSASGFDMVDPSHGNGRTCDMNNSDDQTGPCATFTDADNTWGTGSNASRQTAAVDAHYGAALTFDYYTNVHHRAGIFGTGQGVPSRVHFGDEYVNAFWDGEQMTYGDGAGNADPLVAIDVAGHEMSHGVTENVVPGGLNYSGESGGLNEATSDIFGTMVEFYANNPADPGDYDIGEKININGDGTPLRYMYNPALDGLSDSCWSTGTAAKNVHYSSGVANHFFFDLAEGTGATQYGTSPVCGSASPVGGIGRQKAEQIWFRALDTYFTSTTAYVDTANPGNTARAYSLSAASDLYGHCSVEYKTVQAAWTAVNVAGSDPVCTSDGNDFSVVVSPLSGSVPQGGGTATAAVNTGTTAGTSQALTLSATGVPSGATASFDPASLASGASSTLKVSTSASTPPGTYPITVVAKGVSATHSATFTLTVVNSCVAPGQKLGNAGFESGTAPWTSSPGVIGAFTAYPAHSGARFAWLNGYGAKHTDTLSQSVSLPAGCHSYTLSYWLRVDTAETTGVKDTLTVRVRDAGGVLLGTVATYSNLDESTGYGQKSVSLAAYAGRTVTLEFTGVENGSKATSFVLDDTALNVT
jgi:Zn-dependent metalloprotease